MGVVQLRQIKNHIASQFGPYVDVADYEGKPQSEIENARLTRGLSAFAIAIDNEIEPKKACSFVTDGYNDNGIDCIYFDANEKTLWLCQAKWSSDGSSIFDQASCEKFIRGVKDMLTLNFERFNNRVNSRRVELETAVNAALRIVLVLASTGAGKIGDHPLRVLEEYLGELNDTGDVASLMILTQEQLYTAVSQGGRPDPVDIEVQLFDWGSTKVPYQAFYGQVAASDIANWGARYRGRLFSKNIRSFLGSSTQVNNSIVSSLRGNPGHFWYLNNGITVLCQNITKKPIGGATHDSGVFHCQGMSVVNGAQTVGVITELAATHQNELAQARVPIRLISLQGCPPEFAMDVTKATNTQNRVDLRNFVALDPEQERLRSELLIDGIEYEYRQGEGEPSGSNRFGLVDATVALACSQSTVDLAVQAKREISKLWEDLDGKPYKLMFNSSLSGLRLWHIVQILRYIDEAIESEKKSSSNAKRKNLLTHGNRFLVHKVMQRLDLLGAGSGDFRAEDSIKKIKVDLNDVADKLEDVINKKFADSYLASLFKNAAKCRELAAAI